MWGGDFFHSDHTDRATANEIAAIDSLTSFGPAARRRGTIECHRP